MPTYEYACRSCSEHLEVVQSFKDDPLTTCPACGGQLRKVFGAIGIAFKGSGFYKNDSRAAASKESKSRSGAEKADKKADTKVGDAAGGSAAKSDGPTPKSDSTTAAPSPSTPKTDPKAAASS